MNGKPFPKYLSVRYRYALSFLLISVIPIVLILIFFYQYNLEELKKDVDAINLNRVSQIQNGFETEIKKQRSLASSLYENSSFIPLANQDSLVSDYEALIILRQSMGYRDLNRATAVLLTGKNRVYTSAGCSSYDAYLTSALRLDPVQAEQFRVELAQRLSGVTSVVLPVRQSSGSAFLVCAYPIPGYWDPPAAVLISGFDSTQIMDLFNPLLSHFDGTAFILGGQGELIFTMPELPDSLRGAILAADYQGSEQVLSVTADGKDYSIIFSQSHATGLLYGVATEEDSYLTQIVKQTTLIWQVAWLALALCVIAAVLLAVFHYMPVKRILELTGRPAGLSGNEYRQIREAFIDTSTRAEQLEATLEQQRPYVLERLLGYVLYAQVEPDMIRQFFQTMDIRFDYPAFFVMCVRILRTQTENRGRSFFKTAVIDAVSAMDSPDYSCYTLERLDENELVIVVNCTSSIDQRACAERLHATISEHAGNDGLFTIGVGTVQASVEEIKDSLYEASVLAESQVSRQIAYPEDMEDTEDLPDLYPTKDLLLFQLQLRQGDAANACRTFRKLCAKAEDASHSQLLSRYLYSYIINAIAEVVQQVGRGNFSTQIRRLMQFKTEEELIFLAEELISSFCQSIHESKKNSTILLRDRILEYVRDNLSDVNLSLESIGEAFGLSPYYVSRFFREQNKVNLKDYIARQRLSIAKEMLANTSKSVGEIVNAIGYVSVSSFIRKFKLSEGITPGEYRDRCRQSG